MSFEEPPDWDDDFVHGTALGRVRPVNKPKVDAEAVEEQFKANLRVSEEDEAAAAAKAKKPANSARRGSITLSESMAKGARRASSTKPSDFALKPGTEVSSTLNPNGAGKFNDIGNTQKGQVRAKSAYELEKSRTQADDLFAAKIRRRSSFKGGSSQGLTSP